MEASGGLSRNASIKARKVYLTNGKNHLDHLLMRQPDTSMPAVVGVQHWIWYQQDSLLSIGIGQGAKNWIGTTLVSSSDAMVDGRPVERVKNRCDVTGVRRFWR